MCGPQLCRKHPIVGKLRAGHARPLQRSGFFVFNYTTNSLQYNAILKDRNLAEALLLGTGLLAGGNIQHQPVQVGAGLIQRALTIRDHTGVEVDPSLFLGSQLLLVAIFSVGAGAPNGVPRPVLNSTMWAPAAVSAVALTRSLPGPYSIFRPLVVTGSP